MVNSTEKVKRISLFFNEDDQRSSFVYDFLQEKGRKKTKYIIDLILSNLSSEEFEQKTEKQNTIEIVDPNKPHKERKKLSGQEIYSDNNQNKIMVDGSPVYENDSSVSSISTPSQMEIYTPPISNNPLPTQNIVDSNETKNEGKKEDPFLSKIMSGLSAFDEF